MKLISIAIFLVLSSVIAAQKVPSMTVENIPTDKAIQIIEAASKEFNYELKQFDRVNKVLITDWIQWTSIAITNHGKLKFEANNNQVIVSMIDREYESSEGWSPTLTNLSKKNIKKYLGGMANKITAIAADDNLCLNALYQSELIKMFKPMVATAGLEWKFIHGEKNAALERMKTPNYFMELSVTNTSDHPIPLKLFTKSVQYRDPEQKNAGTANGYTVMSIDEIFSGTWKAELQPNETRKVFIYSLLKYEHLVVDDIIPLFVFDFGIEADTKRYEVNNHNVKIPFENKL